MVKCRVCGEEFEHIAWTHLKHKHSMTTEEYREKFPDAPLSDDERKEKISKGVKNSEKYWEGIENPERGNKISQALSGREKSEKTKKKISKSKSGVEIWGGSRPEAKEWMKDEKNPNFKEKVEKECQECGEKFKVKPSLADTAKYCSRECKDNSQCGQEAWNKGLTKEDDDRVRKYTQKMRKTKQKGIGVKKGENHPKPHKGKTWEEIMGKEAAKKRKEELKERLAEYNPFEDVDTSGEKNVNYGGLDEEQRKKMQETIQKQWKNGRKVEWPKPYYVEELGHEVRSSWEEKIGLMLVNLDIDYEYERKFEVGVNDSKKTFHPDFTFQGIVVEPHVFIKNAVPLKFREFHKQYSEYYFIVIGEKDFNNPNFCDEYLLWEEKEKLHQILEENIK